MATEGISDWMSQHSYQIYCTIVNLVLCEESWGYGHVVPNFYHLHYGQWLEKTNLINFLDEVILPMHLQVG